MELAVLITGLLPLLVAEVVAVMMEVRRQMLVINKVLMVLQILVQVVEEILNLVVRLVLEEKALLWFVTNFNRRYYGIFCRS